MRFKPVAIKSAQMEKLNDSLVFSIEPFIIYEKPFELVISNDCQTKIQQSERCKSCQEINDSKLSDDACSELGSESCAKCGYRIPF